MILIMRSASLLVFLILLFQPSISTSADDGLSRDQWFETVDAVVKDILERLPEEDKNRIRDSSKADLIQFHHGWGTGIRNYYGLWRGNDRLIASACGKPCHPDDASMIIIEAVWEALQIQ